MTKILKIKDLQVGVQHTITLTDPDEELEDDDLSWVDDAQNQLLIDKQDGTNVHSETGGNMPFDATAKTIKWTPSAADITAIIDSETGELTRNGHVLLKNTAEDQVLPYSFILVIERT